MSDAAYLAGMFSLEGKIALITGASGGIGGALAAGMARAGAKIVASGRSSERLAQVVSEIAESGGEAFSLAADLSNPDACRSLAEDARDAFGGIDILVNCAGTNRRESIRDVSPETYDFILDVNLKSPYFLSQAVAPMLKERGGGSILHIGSMTSAIGLSSVSVYGMTKSALASLTKTQAMEWAADGIRANCLCPGFIMTPLTEKAVWGDAKKREWLLDRIPMRRPGLPEEMVGMAIYLSSPAASYVTGQSFYIDGGFLAGSPW